MTMERNIELLCVGLTTLDILGYPMEKIPEDEGTQLVERIEVMPAGTAGGAAMVAATLGMRVALASRLGDDRKGRIVRMLLDETTVDQSLLHTLAGMQTSTTILAVDHLHRRPNFHQFGAAMMMPVDEELVEAACAARFVHWGAIGGPLADGGPGAALIEKAKAAGATTSCDLIVPSEMAMQELGRLLPHIDYFLPSAAEACAMTGTDDLGEAGRQFLAMGAGACIIKDGARGALAVRPDVPDMRFPAYKVDVVDTTSCGDSFCAGFLAALARGWTFEDAGAFAAATAAQVAGGLGTLGTLVDFDTTAEAMRTLPRLETA